MVQKQSWVHTSRAESLIRKNYSCFFFFLFLLFCFSWLLSQLPQHTTHRTCSATKTMPWLLLICFWFGRCSHSTVKLIFSYRELGLNPATLVYSGPAWQKHWYMHEEDALQCLGADQGENKSWNRLVNASPQASVVTSCHFKAPGCIQERQRGSFSF